MSEIFMKIDSLQHLEISRQNYSTNTDTEFFTSYGDCLLNTKL